jgi:hypothetical protein
VHADAARGLQIEVRADGLVGVHVRVDHEPARLVGADRQQRQVDARPSAADLGKVRGVPVSPAK